jgi:hypothetical protein
MSTQVEHRQPIPEPDQPGQVEEETESKKGQLQAEGKKPEAEGGKTEGEDKHKGGKKEHERTPEERELAHRLAQIIESGLDRIKPILKMIDDCVAQAEKKKDQGELDEQAFVDQMKPLLEQGGKVLDSTLNEVKALDPDKKMQRKAKHAYEDSEATPDEQKIATGLSELTDQITKTIDNAKKKIEGMPKAKKDLGPLFNLLTQPLFQILSAVGLLLCGVLNLVGQLLNGLGLGSLVTTLCSGLGLQNMLESFGWKMTPKK